MNPLSGVGTVRVIVLAGGFAFGMNLSRPHALGCERGRKRGELDVMPLLGGVFDEFADEKGREDASFLDIVRRRSHRSMRIVERLASIGSATVR
jgi:hypothetical protein